MSVAFKYIEVPLNPNLKIYSKTLLKRVKMFNLLFLNFVPVNTQKKTYKEIASEAALIKKTIKLPY